jgi:hypothetical protein
MLLTPLNWHRNLEIVQITRLIMSISRYDVLKVFVTSKESGTAVGIRLHGRQNLLITIINEISGRSSEDTIVNVGNESIYGETIPSTCISLSEIENISNLRIQFNDPFYLYLRSLRQNIRMIREEVGFEKPTIIRKLQA